jgi:hypothetical protein
MQFEAGLKLAIHLPQPPECWDYRCAPPQLVYVTCGFLVFVCVCVCVVLGIKPRASCVLGKFSTPSYTLSPMLHVFSHSFKIKKKKKER